MAAATRASRLPRSFEMKINLKSIWENLLVYESSKAVSHFIIT